MIRGLLFDLDETLYNEFDYVLSGFHAVAAKVADQWGLNVESSYSFMVRDVLKNGRGQVFDRLAQRFNIPATKDDMAELVQAYRTHQPALSLYEDAAYFLSWIGEQGKDACLGLITDGLPSIQKQKVRGLDLEQRFNAIVYCWEIHAPKPDPRGYTTALEKMNVSAQQVVMIGDRVDHDMVPAKALGMKTIRIKRGRYASVESDPQVIDYEFEKLTDIPKKLLL
jgi:putative hydrolase of the HAD superfamily